MLEYVEEYATAAMFIMRRELTADASLACMRDLR
jgi:hypothetical protein